MKIHRGQDPKIYLAKYFFVHRTPKSKLYFFWFLIKMQHLFDQPYKALYFKNMKLDLNFLMLTISLTSDDGVKTRNES